MRTFRLFLVMAVAGCVAQAAEPEAARRDGGARDGGGGAVLLPPNVGKGYLISDLTKAPDKPTLPEALNKRGMVVWGFYRVCVKTDGTVSDVKIIKSADELVDPSWMKTMRGWRYRPYTVGGRAVPFCHPIRLEVRSR
jgi:outer membrane biosynthesis protein TonB